MIHSLLHVKYLSAKRQNGLISTVTALLRGTACRVTLDDKQFAVLGRTRRAVGKFTGKSSAA